MRAAHNNSLQNMFADSGREADTISCRIQRRHPEISGRHGLVRTPVVVIKTSSRSPWFGVLTACVIGAVMVGLSGGLIACLMLQAYASPMVMSQPAAVPQTLIVSHPAEPSVAGLSEEVGHASAVVSGMSSTVAMLDRQLSELSVEMERLRVQQAEICETVRITKSDLEDVNLNLNNAEKVVALAERQVQALGF